MYLRKSCSHGKAYLSFVQGYRDETGKVKQKTIKKLGFLDDLEKIYDNPIEYFKEEAKKQTSEHINELTIKNLSSKLIEDDNSRKNLGYVILKKIYNELDIKTFFSKKQTATKTNYNLNEIFELLVFSRILFPDSKLSTYNNKDVYFENFQFSEQNMYRSLDYFADSKDELLTELWNITKDKYKRDTSVSYYDTTNYYFEISCNDEDKIDDKGTITEKGLRKKGPSK